MDNLSGHVPEQLDSSAPQKGAVLRMALVRTVTDAIISVFFFGLFFWAGPWQFLVIALAAAAVVVVDGIGIAFILRGKLQIGAWIVIAALFPAILIVSAMISGFGLVMALAVVLLTLTSSVQALPQRQANWAIVISFAVGFFAILVDFAEIGDRLVAPVVVQIFMPVMVGLLILAYLIFIYQQFSNYTLRTKLIITLISVSLLSVGSVAFVANLTTRSALIEAANQKLLAASQQTSSSLDTFIKANQDAIRIEAELPALVALLELPATQRTPDHPLAMEVTAILNSLRRKDIDLIESYALLNAQGVNVVDTEEAAMGRLELENDFFRMPVRSGESYVSPVIFPEDGSEPAIYFSSSVLNRTGDPIGVLRVRYRADILQQIVSQAGSEEEQFFGVLFDENNLHLAHGAAPHEVYTFVGTPSSALLNDLRVASRLPDLPAERLFLELPGLEQNLSRAALIPFFSATDIATGDKINQVAVTQLTTQPWQTAFFQPRDIFLAPTTAQARITLLLATGIAVIVAIIAIGLGQRLASPIVRLTSVAQQVAAGDLEIQANIESQDEIGQLAQAFNGMTDRLRELIGSLEDQVQERTAELALSMEVGQQAAAIRKIDELLPSITRLIRQQFDLHYVAIYFVDDVTQNLIWKVGVSEGGQELAARGEKVPVGDGSLIGKVAASASPIIVSDTVNDYIGRLDLLMPETRSELAVPLLVEGDVLGVLDMQSARIDTFTDANLTVFEAMATQLAISIDGAQQWALAQEAQQRSQDAIRQLSRETWAEQLTTEQKAPGYQYDLDAITALTLDAAETQDASPEESDGLSVPVVIQNQQIGRLMVQEPVERPLSDSDQALMTAVAQQLAQKAENLRLFGVTQQRATREQLARQITDKIRASQDIEAALNTAAVELSKALGTARATVDLDLNEAQEDQNGQEST